MRKAVALIVVTVVVFPLILAALMSFSVSTWALDRGFYLQLVSDERIYEAVLSETPWDSESIFIEIPGASDLDEIPAAALARALREIVTPYYLRSQAVAVVNEVFHALEGRSALLELSVDITPLKDRLRSEPGERFARSLAADLPICENGEAAIASGADLPRCRPAEITETQAAELILSGLPDFLDKLPDEYPVSAQPLRLYFQPEDDFWFGFIGSSRLIWASIILALIAGGFWVGAAFIGGENRRQIVQWLGWPLFVPAVLTLIAGISMRIVAGFPWVEYGIGSWVASDVWYSAEIVEVFTTLARSAIKTIARGFLTAGGVALGMAVGMIVWSFSIQAEEE